MHYKYQITQTKNDEILSFKSISSSNKKHVNVDNLILTEPRATNCSVSERSIEESAPGGRGGRPPGCHSGSGSASAPGGRGGRPPR